MNWWKTAMLSDCCGKLCCGERRGFETANGRGSIFVARVLPAVPSLRLQGRDITNFVSDSVKGPIGPGERPSLLYFHQLYLQNIFGSLPGR